MSQVQVLILGLLLGGVYSLMASGLTLLFGVMRVVNLAHGAFIVIGSYIAFFAFEAWGLDPFLSLLLVMPTFFLLGMVVYRLLFPRIEGTPRYIEMTVLMTFALALIIEGLLSFYFTGIFRSVNTAYVTDAFIVGPLFVPKGQLYASATSLVLLVALFAFLRFTRTGYGIRATMQNRTAAQIVGVNVTRISTVAFGIGMTLAGAAGALVSYLFVFFPARHWQWIAILLALIVLGGLGSLKGAVIGALALAVISSFVSTELGPVWAPMTFFAALFLTLMIRPRGLFGKEVPR